MRHSQSLRNITPRRSQPQNLHSILPRNTRDTSINLLTLAPGGNIKNLASTQNSFPALLTSRKLLQSRVDFFKIGLLTSNRNNRKPRSRIKLLNVNHIETGKSHAIKHYHPQLLVMRRIHNHSRDLVNRIETIHINLSMHHTIKPKSTSENHPNNKRVTFHVRSENPVINPQNTNLPLDRTKPLNAQNNTLPRQTEYAIRTIINLMNSASLYRLITRPKHNLETCQ